MTGRGCGTFQVGCAAVGQGVHRPMTFSPKITFYLIKTKIKVCNIVFSSYGGSIVHFLILGFLP